ncbi:hypothetical protein [Hymenobacter cheonanensis]|uniref:hypothetical protein n=1 Tax=Hymenobacter sp. CA2-7 TaxID=3063993 RepID=UPI0027125C1E|nr:hypothetical protein [Hymenobacter sp. CA2-7]MDO7885974.1 hypothetical protein [Hymenobacter sp. CA2-7]
MKRLPKISAARLALLGLAALLVFGNCTQNVYRVLGPGVTVEQVSQLRRLDDSVHTKFQALRGLPAGEANRAAARIVDSAHAAQCRLLSPAQYERLRQSGQSVLPLRYPRRPPRGYR